MQELPHTHSCFVCGESNPVGLKLIMKTDGNRVTTQWQPAREHVGFKGTVHGGLISTVLDELMVWACAVQTRQFAFCAELNIRFQAPVPPDAPVEVWAELTENKRNRIFQTQGTVRNQEGQVLVTGSGKYLPIKPDDTRALLTDVVGDLAPFIDLPG